MKICPECKRQIPDTREVCRECLKEKHWEHIKCAEANLIFPPRIVKSLTNLKAEIKLDKKDVEFDSGLYLYGPAGAGKTIYAAAILMELKRRSFLSEHDLYIKGQFINVLNLLEDIRASFDKKHDLEPQQIINRCSNADVLVLDDLGGQKVTEWVFNTLLLIINNRYENLRPIIFTSNIGLNDLAGQYGDTRIPSRISEMCRIKQFKNKDHRITI